MTSRRTFLAAATAGLLGALARRASADPTGTLVVESDPPATVVIDGDEKTKQQTPVRRALSAGKHSLTITSLDGKKTQTLRFTIKPGQATTLRVSLG